MAAKVPCPPKPVKWPRNSPSRSRSRSSFRTSELPRTRPGNGYGTAVYRSVKQNGSSTAKLQRSFLQTFSNACRKPRSFRRHDRHICCRLFDGGSAERKRRRRIVQPHIELVLEM